MGVAEDPALFLRRRADTEQGEQHDGDEQDEEDQEQDLRDAGCTGGDACEAEQTRDDGDDGEDDGPLEQVVVFPVRCGPWVEPMCRYVSTLRTGICALHRSGAPTGVGRDRDAGNARAFKKKRAGARF